MSIIFQSRLYTWTVERPSDTSRFRSIIDFVIYLAIIKCPDLSYDHFPSVYLSASPRRDYSLQPLQSTTPDNALKNRNFSRR